jgi:single-strand DNA-binding protein
MAKSINVATLLGNVGNDPEVRSTASGARVATFSLATSQQWTDARGEKQEKTQWHRCVAWNNGNKGGLADVVEKYVSKGDKLHVTGRIEYRQWDDKDGNKRYSTEIVVNDLVLLGSPKGAPSGQANSATRTVREAVNATAKGNDDFDDFPGALEDEDDDLPF